MPPIERFETTARYSRAVAYDGIVFLAGQTASNPNQGIKGQTQQVLEKIDALLARAGTNKNRILSAQVWLRDIERDFADMTAVWEAWSVPGCAPARSIMQATLISPDLLIEIIVIAAV